MVFRWLDLGNRRRHDSRGKVVSGRSRGDSARESSEHAFGPLAALEQALEDRAAAKDRQSYRLLLRFGLVNLAGFALLGAAFGQGWIDIIVRSDSSGLTIAIAGVFLVGLGLAAYRARRISRELNLVRAYDPLVPSRVRLYLEAIRARGEGSRSIAAEALKLKLGDRLGTVRHLANTLVLLGLIGTVIGLIEALGGIRSDAAGNADAIGPMVSTLIRGMSVSLYTTLVGSVLNLWLMANHRVLVSGTVSLATAIIDLGERHARN